MRRLLPALVSLLIFPVIAHASPITVKFEGTIDQQIGFSPSVLGLNIEGTYTFESSTPPLAPGVPFYPGAVTKITAKFGGNSFIVSGSGDMTVDDEPSGDSYFVGLAPGTGTFNGSPTTLGAVIFAFDPTGALLSGSTINTLPAIPPGTALATFQILEGTFPAVGATITELEFARGKLSGEVPEPVSMFLVLFGGGGVVARRVLRLRRD